MNDIEIDEPLDLIRNSLGKQVLIKCRNDREIKGKLHAYDSHMNLLISDVEEYITIIEDNKKKVENKSFGLLFLRGDLVIVLIPQNK